METITRGVINLIGENPFYGALLMQMSRQGKPNLHFPSGVRIHDGRIELLFNEKKLEAIKSGQISGLLEHECLHAVMRHLTRQEERDEMIQVGDGIYQVWNVAIESAGKKRRSEKSKNVRSLIPGRIAQKERYSGGLEVGSPGTLAGTLDGGCITATE